MQSLDEYIKRVQPSNREAIELSRKHWDTIAKPLNSLGELEHLITKISGMQSTPQVDISKKCIIIMCADNGIVEENVTQTDSSITYTVAKNMAENSSNVNLMAKLSNADSFTVDIGMNATVEDGLNIIDRKVSHGTKNFLKAPAMTMEQCTQAILTGIEMVEMVKSKGYNIIATGEMGIGNTTTSSALVSVLLGVEPSLVTGKGAGLSNSGLKRKIEVIQEGIAKHHPDSNSPLEVLSKLGGYDICGMVGVFLGGAIYRIPIVIDGLISAVSALIAYRLSPSTLDYMLPSHIGTEPAMRLIMQELGLNPIIHANMHLGEGTGAVCMFPILDMAMNVYNSNRTFESIGMEAYKEL
jgi:nicotinate-nucleotide--dimethylbenzimidazole phosphoribosyltransferase